MIKVTGQLAIRTVHGSLGDFNVGRLETAIGEFVVKDAELDQYEEGKYAGDFIISKISPYSYHTNGRFVVEVRAILGGMTLSDIDALGQDDANLMMAQEVDPADEETQKSVPDKSSHPLKDTTPFGSDVPVKADKQSKDAFKPFGTETHQDSKASKDAMNSGEAETDESLFGILWPLGEVVKLDATVGRHQFRRQTARLSELEYTFNAQTQEWYLTQQLT